MDNKQEILFRIFVTLRDKGTVRNKKEFAALLDVNYSGLVSAMNGDERFLTDSLVAKAVNLLPNAEPPAPKPKTEVEKAIEAIQSSNQITLKAQEQTDRLLSLLEAQMGIAGGAWTSKGKDTRIKDNQ